MKLYWVRPSICKTWFLYCPEHLPHPDAMTKGPQPTNSLARRLLLMGESKWAEYGRAAPSSFKGQLYSFGQSLINKLPVQEKMWWRVESAMHCNNNEPIHVYHGLDMPDQDKRELIAKIHLFMNKHKTRWIVNSVLAVPVLILTIFPFVKLLLAWIVFRAVTHNRAYHGCRFLTQALPNATFQHHPELLKYEQTGTIIDDHQDFKATMDTFILQQQKTNR